MSDQGYLDPHHREDSDKEGIRYSAGGYSCRELRGSLAELLIGEMCQKLTDCAESSS